MRRLISSINMTLDGFCNHTAVIADDDMHENANDLLRHADTMLLGRITYQLMESSWPPIVAKPTGNQPTDEFAVLIDNIKKVVFSRTLKNVTWKNTVLVQNNLQEEVLQLKEQPGKNIVVGGPTLIVELMKLGLVDEYRFCVQPIILGSGRTLFKDITEHIDLKLTRTETMASGAVMFYYEPVNK